MKKHLFLLPLLLLLAVQAQGQTRRNYAKNIRKTITDDEVRFTYDLQVKNLSPDVIRLLGKKFRVNVEAKNGLATQMRVVRGIGEIAPGPRREVVWVYTADNYTRRAVEKLRFKLRAIDENEKVRNIDATTVGAGSALGGTALLLAGIDTRSKYSESSQKYSVYLEHKDPIDPVWTEGLMMERGQYYDEINKKYLGGQYMMIGGIALIVNGAAMYYVLSKKNQRKSKADRLTLIPLIDVVPRAEDFVLGVRIGYRF